MTRTFRSLLDYLALSSRRGVAEFVERLDCVYSIVIEEATEEAPHLLVQALTACYEAAN